MQVKYNFSVLSLQRLLEILEKRHREHNRDNQCRVKKQNMSNIFFVLMTVIFQTSFHLEIDPLEWGPNMIYFQTCDNLDELILVIRFILKHSLEVSGKLVATFFK